MSRGIGQTQRAALTYLRHHTAQQVESFEWYGQRPTHLRQRVVLGYGPCALDTGWATTAELAAEVERSPRQILAAMRSLQARGLVESRLTDVGDGYTVTPNCGRVFRATVGGRTLTEYRDNVELGTPPMDESWREEYAGQ